VLLRRCQGVTKQIFSRRTLESLAIEGNGPVGKKDLTPGGFPEYGGAREIPSESTGTTP
jgi:hypothetical protein